MESEIFDSVTWDTPNDGGLHPHAGHISENLPGPGYRQTGDSGQALTGGEPRWEGYLDVELKDPIKELDGTKDAYISYLVRGRVRFLLTSQVGTNNISIRV